MNSCEVRGSKAGTFTAFIKRQRGDHSFAAFAKEVGLDAGSLHRLERAEQSITLGRLNRLMKRLKVRLEDVFGRQ